MRIRAPWRMAAIISALALIATACDGDIDDTESPDDAALEQDAAAVVDDDDAAADDGPSADLLGSGASFPNPAYQSLIGEFQEVEPGVSLQYESIGSSGGKEQMVQGLTDFGGTDSVMDDEEQAEAIEARACTEDEVLHIPTMYGGVVIAYNIDGLDDELTLDGATIAGIFSGEITNANDPAIAALNDGVDLPDQDLTVAVRADGSGTTDAFSTYLEDESQDWADQYGSGSEIDWFDGVVGGEQNDGVAATVAAQPGGIGYLSLEFAVAAGLPYADVINADGNAVTPTAESVSAATDGIELPEDLRFDILGVGGEGYPIATATWLLAWTCDYDEGDTEALQAFITYIVEDGADTIADLGYAPISGDALEMTLGKIERINEEG